jgi:hypothetical protein
MRYLILLLAISFAMGEDKPVPQPIEVQRAMAEHDHKVYEARKIYDAATAKISEDTVYNLDKVKLAYMAKGDLEGATLVATAIKKIKDGDALTATEEKIKAASVANILKPTIEQMIVGKWRANHSNGSKDLYILNADKSVRSTGPWGEVSNTWEIKNNILIIKWGANIDSYDIFTPNRLEGKNSSGIKLILNREK